MGTMVLLACPDPLPDYIQCKPWPGGDAGLLSNFGSMGIFFMFAAIGFLVLARFYRVSAALPSVSLAYLAGGIVFELFPIAGIILVTNFEPKGQRLLLPDGDLVPFLVAAAAFFLVGAALTALGALGERSAARAPATTRGT
jgi:hypothetical protein